MTACRWCNPNQRYLFWKFLQGLKIFYPMEYWNFRHFYDPEDKYFEALEQEISKYTQPDMDIML